MTRPQLLVRTLVIVLVCAAAVFGWRAACRPVPVSVRVAPAARGAVEATVANSKAGTVLARVRSRLSAATSGTVAEIAVERGVHVAKGALLLRLDSASQAAELVLTERSVAVAEAVSAKSCVDAEHAARELERNRKLAADQIVSADVLDRLVSALDVARAQCAIDAAGVARAGAALQIARTELDKTVLRAPYDAIVADVPVQLGEWVSPSVPLVAAPTVCDLIDPASLYVSAPMDEVDSGALRVGAPARITLDPFAGRTFTGRVARVAPFVLDIEQQNRTVEIEVELDDAAFARTLLPGTSADVEIVLERRENVLRIPAAALLPGGRVLVLERGVLVERALQLGLRNWDWCEVQAGLAEGDEVITSLQDAAVRAGARATVHAEPER